MSSVHDMALFVRFYFVLTVLFVLFLISCTDTVLYLLLWSQI